MVAVALTDEMIGAGGALVRKLDERGLRPDDAFWLYSSDTERWKLVIAEVSFGKQGPRETYKQIQNAIAALDNEPIALASVTLARPDGTTSPTRSWPTTCTRTIWRSCCTWPS